MASLVSGLTSLCGKCAQVLPVESFTHLANGCLSQTCNKCRTYDSEYNRTDNGRKRFLDFKNSAKGVECRSRYLSGEAAKAAKVRMKDAIRERRRSDPLLRKRDAIKCAASNVVAGRIATSETFVERTAFESTEDFLDVIKMDAVAKGFQWAKYGSEWQIDHKIPQDAFDFGNDDDVRRCWSRKNVHCLSTADNKAKSWKLLDHYLMEAGAENFPTSWNGQLPDEEFKRNFYAQRVAPKDVGGPSTSEPPGDVEEGPDSDSD
jgi:hypothetical protein